MEVKILYKTHRNCAVPFIEMGTETETFAYLKTPPRDLYAIVCETFYKRWNAGSGQESQTFLDLNIRSMSVGDMVFFPNENAYFECTQVGWVLDFNMTEDDVMWRQVGVEINGVEYVRCA